MLEATNTGVYTFNHHKRKLLKTYSEAWFNKLIMKCDDPGDRLVQDLRLLPLDCSVRGFKSRGGPKFPFIVFFVCCVGSGLSATSWSLVQRSPTGCVHLIVCDLETSTMTRPTPEIGCRATQRRKKWVNHTLLYSRTFKAAQNRWPHHEWPHLEICL
jgi:hypothetical protein